MVWFFILQPLKLLRHCTCPHEEQEVNHRSPHFEIFKIANGAPALKLLDDSNELKFNTEVMNQINSNYEKKDADHSRLYFEARARVGMAIGDDNAHFCPVSCVACINTVDNAKAKLNEEQAPDHPCSTQNKEFFLAFKHFTFAE